MTKAILVLIALVSLIQVVAAENLILAPSNSACDFIWKTNFTDTFLSVQDNYIIVGGLAMKAVCFEQGDIVIYYWNPDNLNTSNEVIVAFTANTDADIYIWGLESNWNYLVSFTDRSQTVTSNQNGVIHFTVTKGAYVVSSGNASKEFISGIVTMGNKMYLLDNNDYRDICILCILVISIFAMFAYIKVKK